MSHQSTPFTIGIDIGKNTFHLVGLDQRGNIVLQLKTSRAQLERRLANVPRCLIGMEACSGAHHIGRQLEALDHDVRLISAQNVKPFLKGHKNDYRDAEGSRRPCSALMLGACRCNFGSDRALVKRCGSVRYPRPAPAVCAPARTPAPSAAAV
jgi:hypothetical protein